MTRLTTEDIKHIPNTMTEYDRTLERKTGCRLVEIAAEAAQFKGDVRKLLVNTSAAIVPVTAGRGIIEGFSEAVAAILGHIGINASVTESSDIAGMTEAFEGDADLVFAADDNEFVAMNLATKHISRNATATARAYVAALNHIAKGLAGKPVLVIGIGNVGSEAVTSLIALGAIPLVVDIDKRRVMRLSRKYRDHVRIFRTVAEALRHTSLIIDAAPARNVIRSDMITADTMISAPSVPLGLTRAALKRISERNLIHDPLQLGVAAMAVEACAR
jgi:pyrrolysine biosynthesis protein PylD